MSKGCGIEFPHFGAIYPDARCCNGYLWDMDSWDESLGGFTIGGDEPCPVCNTEKWLDYVVDEDGEFETREKALAYVEQLKKRYLNYGCESYSKRYFPAPEEPWIEQKNIIKWMKV